MGVATRIVHTWPSRSGLCLGHECPRSCGRLLLIPTLHRLAAPFGVGAGFTSGMNAQDPAGAGLVSTYNFPAAACFKINSTIGAGSTRLWG